MDLGPYGNFAADCPARIAADLFGNSWLTVIVYTLRDGPVVERRRYAEAPPRVEYSLTKAGRDLLVPIFALGAWADEHGDTVRTAMFGES
jgi:DNA-binding HxlR family transcriptional regulator